MPCHPPPSLCVHKYVGILILLSRGKGALTPHEKFLLYRRKSIQNSGKSPVSYPCIHFDSSTRTYSSSTINAPITKPTANTTISTISITLSIIRVVSRCTIHSSSPSPVPPLPYLRDAAGCADVSASFRTCLFSPARILDISDTFFLPPQHQTLLRK